MLIEQIEEALGARNTNFSRHRERSPAGNHSKVPTLNFAEFSLDILYRHLWIYTGFQEGRWKKVLRRARAVIVHPVQNLWGNACFLRRSQSIWKSCTKLSIPRSRKIFQVQTAEQKRADTHTENAHLSNYFVATSTSSMMFFGFVSKLLSIKFQGQN